MGDDLPQQKRIVPSQTRIVHCHPDPDLCLTPDVRKNATQNNTRKVRFRDVRNSLDYDDVLITKVGNGRKVISDEKVIHNGAKVNDSTSRQHKIIDKRHLITKEKVYSPQRYSDVDYLSVDYSNCSLDDLGDEYDWSSGKKLPYVISENGDGDKTFDDIEIIANDYSENSMDNSNENGVEILIECGESYRKTDEQKPDHETYPFSENKEDVSMEYSAFSRPEYNTTLRIGEQIKTLKSSKPDVVKAVKEKLKSSEMLRTTIGEKAASRTNRTSQQFNDLVSVDVSDVKVIRQAERQKQIRVPRPTHQPTSKFAEPDITRFLTNDLQHENVDLSLDGLGVKLPDDKLLTANLSSCYDLYLHNKVWDGE